MVRQRAICVSFPRGGIPCDRPPRTCHADPQHRRRAWVKKENSIMTATTARPAFSAARIAAVLAIVAMGLFSFGERALAQGAQGAEDYIRANVQKGLTILNDRSIPDMQRRLQFRDFLTNLTDIRRIAIFTLRAARRTATPQQLDS